MNDYIITYHMHPSKDIVITIKANNEEEAVIYAKGYRKDAFTIAERKGQAMTVKLTYKEIELIQEALYTLWADTKDDVEKRKQLIDIDSKLRTTQVEGGAE